MKKIFTFSIVLLCILSSVTYGSVSEDTEVYLRKDVFDSKMEAFMTEMRAGFQMINTRLDTMDKRLDAMDKRLDGIDQKIDALTTRVGTLEKRLDIVETRLDVMNNRINDVQTTLSARIDDYQATTNNRIEDLKTTVYWGFTFLGLILAFAVLGPSVSELIKNLRKPLLTLEDVERLIDAKLTSLSQ